MSEQPVGWTVMLPGARNEVRFDRVDPDRDCTLIHDWMNRRHVSPWWELDRPYQEVYEYLTSLTHLHPWLVSTDGMAFGYVETYRVVEDPLAESYPARDDDQGWHVLVGPRSVLGTGIPRLMGRAVLAYLLNRAGRAVCEPDARNDRMLAFCRRLGHRDLGRVDLPEKRAALMACTRAEFDARWPGDREAVSVCLQSQEAHT
ncbi:MAG TPA: GNAT family N-acetyltransferase [Nocardioidaceae bacterium]|nr:GNAT family N-acetyltransferase [Nocardioidaceae bacterium]